MNPFFSNYPVSISDNMTDFINQVNSFDNDAFQKNLKDFMTLIKNFNDGNASKRVIKYMESKI